jgi:rod shape-determining protein MreC
LPPYGSESESGDRRRDLLVAAAFLVVALSTLFLAPATQQSISTGLQLSVLRPFISVQRRLEESRIRAERVEAMMLRIDSLSAMLSTHSAIVDENRTLRTLLGLTERTGPAYLPATVLRPGTPGAESMFILDVGSEDGVRDGAPVVGTFGLVGVVRESRLRDAVGMDWTHPDFRASAMLQDGSAFGLVERQEGSFREADRLTLNGIPFNEPVTDGTLVVTSGLGGVFPRGIPIGRIAGLAETEGDWRKSYWLDPVVRPGSATHVLVLTDSAGADVSAVWAGDSIR